MARRLTVLCAAALAVTLIFGERVGTQSADPPPSYGVIEVPLPAGAIPLSGPFGGGGINRDGVVVGAWSLVAFEGGVPNGEAPIYGFRWAGGQPTAVTVDPSLMNQMAEEYRDRGHAQGNSCSIFHVIPRAISDAGTIVGSFGVQLTACGFDLEGIHRCTSAMVRYEGFSQSANGTTIIRAPGPFESVLEPNPSTYPWGIANGTVVGDYQDPDRLLPGDAAHIGTGGIAAFRGFVGAGRFDFPGATQTSPRGINLGGDIVGSYSYSPFWGGRFADGFLYTPDYPDSPFTPLTIYGAKLTQPMAINNHRDVVGIWGGYDDVEHSFVWPDVTGLGESHPITDGTHDLFVRPVGINDAGQIFGIKGSPGGTAATTRFVIVEKCTVNHPPTAHNGGSYFVDIGDALQLDGSASFEPDRGCDDSLTYSWTISGGSLGAASNSMSPYLSAADVRAFLPPGHYTLSLKVTDTHGASNTETTTLDVYTAQVVASYTASPSPARCTLTVEFDASGSRVENPRHSIVSYAWDFGDGTAPVETSSPTLTHVFNGYGGFTPLLRVTSDLDDSTTATYSTLVVLLPNRAPTAQAGGPYHADLHSTVTLDGSASSDPDTACLDLIANYDWTIDGQHRASGAAPALSPSQVDSIGVGTHMVTLTVRDTFGLEATSTTSLNVVDNRPIASFDAFPTQAACNQVVSFNAGSSRHGDPQHHSITNYAWNFGDGSSGSGTSVSHAYSRFGDFTALLTVTDDQARTDSTSTTIHVNVNHMPTANAGGPYSADLHAPFSLNGFGSTDGDPGCGDSLTYQWTVDGTLSFSGPTPGLSAAQIDALGAGGHFVQLTVTDSLGAQSSATAMLNITENRPFARFIASPNPAACGQTISFDASTSTHTRSDRHIVSYSWNFGDGGGASGPFVTRSYGRFGSYTATLTVLDNNSPPKTDQTSTSIQINQGNQPPVARPGGPYTVTLGGGISLNGGASSDPNTSCGDLIVSYQWTIKTLSVSGPTPFLSASQISGLGAGTHTVSLKVTDSLGLSHTTTTSLKINNGLSLGLPMSLEPTVGSAQWGCGSFFDANAAGGSWTGTINYGDSPNSEPLMLIPPPGPCGQGGSPPTRVFSFTHVYSSPGPRTVTVTITNDVTHASTTGSFPVNVVAPTPPCATLTFNLSGNVPFESVPVILTVNGGTMDAALPLGTNAIEFDDDEAAIYHVRFNPPAGYAVTPSELEFTVTCGTDFALSATIGAAPTPATVTSIDVAPSTVTLTSGQTVQHIASARFSDGSVRRTDGWSVQPPMAAGRFGHGAVTVNGVLYVVGGTHGATAVTQVDAFNPVSGTWSSPTSLPTPRTHLAVAALGGRIFAAGGDDGGVITDRVEVYNPSANSWSTVAHMLTPRARFALVKAGQYLYAFGGQNSSGELSSIERYDPVTNAWTAGASMPMPRASLAAGAIDNGATIVVAGGVSFGSSTASVDLYDVGTNSWSPGAPLLSPRSGAAAGIIDDTLVVLGGDADGSLVLSGEVYVPSASAGEQDSWNSIAGVPTARTSLAIGALGNTLYVTGGTTDQADPPTDSEALEAFTPPDSVTTWTSTNSLVAVVDDRGVATARASGQATIVAAFGGINCEATSTCGVLTVVNTPAGTNVILAGLVDETTGGPAPAQVTFDSVTAAGDTTFHSEAVPSGLPFRATGISFELTTTAQFTMATVCVPYDAAALGAGETAHLYHLEAGQWVDVTASVDQASSTVCGRVSSFSPFVVGVPKAPTVAEIVSSLMNDTAAEGFQQAGHLLQSVLKSLDSTNTKAACNQLGGFINQVQAQSGKKLTTGTASGYVLSANRARGLLRCK